MTRSRAGCEGVAPYRGLAVSAGTPPLFEPSPVSSCLDESGCGTLGASPVSFAGEPYRGSWVGSLGSFCPIARSHLWRDLRKDELDESRNSSEDRLTRNRASRRVIPSPTLPQGIIPCLLLLFLSFDSSHSLSMSTSAPIPDLMSPPLVTSLAASTSQSALAPFLRVFREDDQHLPRADPTRWSRPCGSSGAQARCPGRTGALQAEGYVEG